jgi:hypothetical protein
MESGVRPLRGGVVEPVNLVRSRAGTSAPCGVSLVLGPMATSCLSLSMSKPAARSRR